MPPNKKKGKKQRKKVAASSSADSSSNGVGDGGLLDADLNAQVLESLTRLSDTLARLDEARHHHDDDDGGEEEDAAAAVAAREGGAPADDDAGAATAAAAEDGGDAAAAAVAEDDDHLAEATGAMSLVDGNSDADGTTAKQAPAEIEEGAVAGGTDQGGAGPLSSTTLSTTLLTPLPALPLSHWRTLPLPVSSAYDILRDGAEYLHATSTKYTLVGKVDSKEGGNLALELRKGAELIGTGTLLLYSESCGSSRSLRRYAKQSSRAVVASVASLVRAFDDGLAQGRPDDGNNLGAQRTGAVWSACDSLTKSLPRGNRAAMRRELMVWVRDCNESIGEFEESLQLGPREDGDEGGTGEEEEDDMMDEEQYTEREIGVAKAAVNVMKCSKNLLGLVLKACECVGDHVEKSLPPREGEKKGGIQSVEDDGNKAASDDETRIQGADESDAQRQKQQQRDAETEERRRKEMLQWIGNLHEMARTVGEGVTNFGILLYPPLDASRDQAALKQWHAKKPKAKSSSDDEDEDSAAIPSLGSTVLGLQLEHQLHALSECVLCVNDASLLDSAESIRSCLSEEVTDGVERLRKAVGVRCKEVEGAMGAWDR